LNLIVELDAKLPHGIAAESLVAMLAVTLEFLAEDYLAHLLDPLRQMGMA
jgi:hypothetical protein